MFTFPSTTLLGVARAARRAFQSCHVHQQTRRKSLTPGVSSSASDGLSHPRPSIFSRFLLLLLLLLLLLVVSKRRWCHYCLEGLLDALQTVSPSACRGRVSQNPAFSVSLSFSLSSPSFSRGQAGPAALPPRRSASGLQFRCRGGQQLPEKGKWPWLLLLITYAIVFLLTGTLVKCYTSRFVHPTRVSINPFFHGASGV